MTTACDVCSGKGKVHDPKCREWDGDPKAPDAERCDGWHPCWKCGPKIKFRKETDEVVCGGHPCQDYDNAACMRAFGHEGPHVGLARDANIADGVCWSCRAKPGAAHWSDCTAGNAS